MAEEFQEDFSVLPQRYNEFIKRHQEQHPFEDEEEEDRKGKERVDFSSPTMQSSPSSPTSPGAPGSSIHDSFLYPTSDDKDMDQGEARPADGIFSTFGKLGFTDDYMEGEQDDDDDDAVPYAVNSNWMGFRCCVGFRRRTKKRRPVNRFAFFVLLLLVFCIVVATVAILLYQLEKGDDEPTRGQDAGKGSTNLAPTSPKHKHNATANHTHAPHTHAPHHAPHTHAPHAPHTHHPSVLDAPMHVGVKNPGPVAPVAPVAPSSPAAWVGWPVADPAQAPAPAPVLPHVWRRRGTDMIGDDFGFLLGETVVLNGAGDVVAVGAPGANQGAGQVQVYFYYQREWNPMGSVLPGVGQFGVSLDLSENGHTLAVGGHLAANSDDGQVKGHVRVFKYHDTHHDWLPKGDPLEGDQENENLGWSVSLSGDGNSVAVGSPSYGDLGRVQLFHYDHQSQWVPIGAVVVEASRPGTGYAVSLSHNAFRLAVVSTGGNDEPHMSVWQRFNHTKWLPMGSPITNIGTEHDHLGQRIELSGDGSTLVVSARFASHYGFTQVYQWQSGYWVELGQTIDANEDYNGDGVTEDHTSCSINQNGTHIAIGSPLDHDLGRVRIYQLHSSDSWWYQVGEDIHGPHGFGAAVSLSSDASNVAIGANGFNHHTGMARVYARHSQYE